jgi:transketolase
MSVYLAKNHSDGAEEMRKTYVDTLLELAKEDERICVMDADLMNAAGTKPFKAEYPERTFDCGVQEANMIGVAAGLSATGLIPFTHTFSAFASRRACDQIFMSCLYAKQNVKIVGSDPGITAALNGGTHMSFEDVGILRSMPTAVIVEPSDNVALQEIIRLARDTYGTWYIRLPRRKRPMIYAEGTTFEIGKSNMLTDGNAATIIASGVCVAEALKAAEVMKAENIEVRVLDMFTIKPIDREAVIKAAKETGAIVTAENHNVMNGLGSAVADVLCGNDCYVPLEKIGVQDIFGEVGTADALAERFGLTSVHIAEAVKKAIQRKK